MEQVEEIKLNGKPVESDVVEFAKNNMLSEKVATDMVEFYKLFSDFTRVKILYVLSMAEMCVSDIALVLNMHQSTISHQLKTLRASKLVKHRRQGKIIFYSLDDEHIGQVLLQGLLHVGAVE